MEEKKVHWLQRSPGLKFALLAVLSLFLLIPVMFVSDIVRERMRNHEEVQMEIGSKWGNPQRLVGPRLYLPYRILKTGLDGKKFYQKGELWVLPEHLELNGDLQPTIKQRGIYKTVLYTLETEIQARFNPSDWLSTQTENTEWLWNEAFVSLEVSDQKGIAREVVFDIDGQKLKANPGSGHSELPGSGMHAELNKPFEKAFVVKTKLSLKGSGQLHFSPMGKTTEVELASTWKDPKFLGAFLPENEVTEQGFTAKWTVLDFNRNFPQVWKNQNFMVEEADFGLQLLDVYGQYRLAERSLKYALLVIALTFAAFFFYEVLQKRHIHPIQYSLVGFALLVFYLLLISLSEHMRFVWAYWTGAVAVVLLVSAYFAAISGNLKQTFGMGSLFATLYGFLYVVLTHDDYALLMGSLGLFVAISLIMWFTRKVNWYEI